MRFSQPVLSLLCSRTPDGVRRCRYTLPVFLLPTRISETPVCHTRNGVSPMESTPVKHPYISLICRQLAIFIFPPISRYAALERSPLVPSVITCISETHWKWKVNPIQPCRHPLCDLSIQRRNRIGSILCNGGTSFPLLSGEEPLF